MKEFIKSNIKDDRTYVNYLLAYHCMPTLIKIKPSNMITVNKSYCSELGNFFRRLQDELSNFQCKFIMLYENEIIAVIMIYNETINNIILDKDNRAFLLCHGYPYQRDNFNSIMLRLKERYFEYNDNKQEFPHEIGVLLGYPLYDVEGFIQNKGKNYLICGYWKVYQKKEIAEMIFAAYNMAREKGIQVYGK